MARWLDMTAEEYFDLVTTSFDLVTTSYIVQNHNTKPISACARTHTFIGAAHDECSLGNVGHATAAHVAHR